MGMPGRVPNGLLRSTQTRSAPYARTTARMQGMYAKGGSVKKAVSALDELRSFFKKDKRRARHLRELLEANPEEPDSFRKMSPGFRRDLINYLQYQPELLEAGATDDLNLLRAILKEELD